VCVWMAAPLLAALTALVELGPDEVAQHLQVLVGLNARRPNAPPTGVAAALGSTDWAVRKAAAVVCGRRKPHPGSRTSLTYTTSVEVRLLLSLVRGHAQTCA